MGVAPTLQLRYLEAKSLRRRQGGGKYFWELETVKSTQMTIES